MRVGARRVARVASSTVSGTRRTAQGLGDAVEAVIRRYSRREPKQSRSRALVDAVLEAADELIRREPMDVVTVERVSERAGIGMGSFYEYFHGKDSLVGVLIGKVTRSNFEDLSQTLEGLEGDSLEELVRGFSRTTVEAYLAHPHRTRVLAEAAGRLGLGTLIHEEKDRFARVMARRAAAFLPGEPLDGIEATMRLLADAAMGVVLFTALRGGPIDSTTLAADLAEMGLVTLRRRHPDRSNVA